MSITKERFFNEFKKDQATYDEIHENILDGVNIGGSNFIILMCAPGNPKNPNIPYKCLILSY